MIRSPLTGNCDVSYLRSIKVEQLIKDWNKAYKIDISQELETNLEVCLYQCHKTYLKFFYPTNLTGSENFYSNIAKFDWYYMPRKWEHDIAFRDIQKYQSVLEVGCGRGAFVKRLQEKKHCEVLGIELNPSAVDDAKTQGLSVENINLYELAEQKPNYFDVVCSFQVLEHVSNPLDFLKASLKLIKPGGKLLLSVPNSDSFPKYDQNNLLDQPPHHVTQWCEKTFKCLQALLPVKLVQVRTEPLASYHIDWYLSLQLSRVPSIWPLKSLIFRFAYHFWRPLLYISPFFRKFIQGHTIYVCFQKVE